MMPLLALFLASFCAAPQAQGMMMSDALLSARIKQLLHTVLTSDSDSNEEEDAQVREIFNKRGLPTIREVGDEASYDFLVLLGHDPLLLELQSQVLAKLRKAAATGDVPADSAVYYQERLRLKRVNEAAAKRPPDNSDLRDRIEILVKIDQAVRQQKDFDAAKMREADARSAAALREILDKYGVPTFDMVGPQAAGDFVLMIQHQPPQFREQVLPMLKLLVDGGQADPNSYALVYDRSQRDQGKKQFYGEQLECRAGETMSEAPIEDEEHVNERRAELGLIRIELYASMIREVMPQFCPSVAKPPSP